MSSPTIQRVESCLLKYLEPSRSVHRPIAPDTDLLNGLGLCSDQGLELVLDLCDEFEFDFPKDFNPLIHPSGNRGMKLRELVAMVDSMTEPKEAKR